MISYKEGQRALKIYQQVAQNYKIYHYSKGNSFSAHTYVTL